MSAPTEVEHAVERAARDSYGRLVAFLAARSHDVARAEDALGDAFRIALESWPRSGVPAQPEAWLLTAARRRLIDLTRHSQVESAHAPSLAALYEEARSLAEQPDALFPDERLELLFVCAHPSINPSVRTALLLQTVLGLDAARIASAFVLKPSTMGQRLSRAKTRIRDARIRFEVPTAEALPERLDAVLEAIYAAYGSGWDDVAGADPRRRGLAAEAIELARLTRHLLPGEPEVNGLLALMLHCEARRAARRSCSGEYVPLAEQDVTLWSRDLVHEAEALLHEAAKAGAPGRFQLEAAIQSAHAARLRTGVTDWHAIAVLYEGLVRIAPTLGALIGRAAAVAELRGAAVAWPLLEEIDRDAAAGYQPYWALRAHLLQRLGRSRDAETAFVRAIGLCTDAATRTFLMRRAERVAAAP